jgi:uncharacterized membrane protein YtjA (UPF0391 family)
MTRPGYFGRDVAAGNRIQQGVNCRALPTIAQSSTGASGARFGTCSTADSWIDGPRERAGGRELEEISVTLLKWALIFLVISIIAGILGFTGISAASADVARFLFYVFVVIFLVLLILGLTIFRV